MGYIILNNNLIVQNNPSIQNYANLRNTFFTVYLLKSTVSKKTIFSILSTRKRIYCKNGKLKAMQFYWKSHFIERFALYKLRCSESFQFLFPSFPETVYLYHVASRPVPLCVHPTYIFERTFKKLTLTILLQTQQYLQYLPQC